MNARGLDSITQAEGQPRSLVVYDALNRVTAAYDTVGASPTTLRYDALYQTAVTDPKGQLYKREVNALGWPTRSYDPKDTVGIYTAAQYDAAGQVKHARNRRGQWIVFQYDALGRLTSRRDSLAPADSFQYLDHGRVVIAKNSIETDTLRAGKAGADTTSTVLGTGVLFRRRWTKTQGVFGDTLTDSSSATGLTFLKQRRYWSTTTGALDSIVVGTSKVRFTTDAELLPDSTIYPNYAMYRLHTSTHDDYKTVYSTTVLDSIFSRTYSFDSLGRISSEAHIGGYQNGWTYDLRSYAYNASGPLRWYQRATTTNRSCEPDYGCLPASTVPYQTYSYPHYDGAINLLTRVDSTHGNAKDSATFAVGNRVTSWLGVSYTYDADGNRATRTVGSTLTTYKWDASGRLLQVRTGTDSVTYAYNALGQLARRSSHGAVDRWFIWEAGQLLDELDGTGQHRVNEFAYLPGTDAPLVRITGDGSTTIEYVQQDARGDVIGLTSGSGMTQHLLYGPWGNLEAVSGDSLPQTRLGWHGLVWEGGAAQLYYVRSRWYDPARRSFLSEDPLGLSGGRNTYAYADNDAVNGWDPSGTLMVFFESNGGCQYSYNRAAPDIWTFDISGCGGGPDPFAFATPPADIPYAGDDYPDADAPGGGGGSRPSLYAVIQQTGRLLKPFSDAVNCGARVAAVGYEVYGAANLLHSLGKAGALAIGEAVARRSAYTAAIEDITAEHAATGATIRTFEHRAAVQAREEAEILDDEKQDLPLEAIEASTKATLKTGSVGSRLRELIPGSGIKEGVTNAVQSCSAVQWR